MSELVFIINYLNILIQMTGEEKNCASDTNINLSDIRVGVKRKINNSELKNVKAKVKRNSGECYVSPSTHKFVQGKNFTFTLDAAR